MAEKNGYPLRDLLPTKIDDLQGIVKGELCKDADIKGLPLVWGFIASEANEALDSVLDGDAFALLAQGWCKLKELHEYTDSSKHPHGERSIVHLGKHKFVKSVHPILTLSIGASKLAQFRFTLDLAANFRSAALAICDGYITSVAAGDGSVSAELKYDDAELYKTPESKKVAFPGRLDFKPPGLAIG